MKYKLNQLLKLRYGKRQVDVEDVNGAYPIFGTGGVFGYANEFLYNKPSILIGRKGTLDKPRFIDTPFWVVDTMFFSEINSDLVLPKYLYYKLLRIDFNQLNEGTTIPSLRVETLNALEIEIHDMPTQQHIVNLLGSLDEKVENNERIIAETIKLCDYKYKRAIADSTKIALGEIIEIHDSKRIPLSGNERDAMEKKYCYYGATGVLDYVDNFLFFGTYVLIAEDGSVIDSNGFPIVQFVTGEFWVNNHAHILKGTNGVSEAALYIILKNTQVKEAVTGAVQMKINQANLCSLKINLPRDTAAFNSFVDSLFQKIEMIKSENQKLNELKQLYLKKFFG